MKTGTRTVVGEMARVGQLEDLSDFVDKLSFLSRVAVGSEGVDMGNKIERDLMSKVFRLDWLATHPGLSLRAQFFNPFDASARDGLIAGRHYAPEPAGIVQRFERHRR